MWVYIEFESTNVVHVLMVDFGLLHLIWEDFIFEGLEDFMPYIKVDIEFLNSWDEIFMNQLELDCIDFLYDLSF